jgi:hypothetical protein
VDLTTAGGEVPWGTIPYKPQGAYVGGTSGGAGQYYNQQPTYGGHQGYPQQQFNQQQQQQQQPQDNSLLNLLCNILVSCLKSK